jgi:hypothetical protein
MNLALLGVPFILFGIAALSPLAAQSGPMLQATPASGPAPFAVQFIGRGDGATYFGGVSLDFGDGQMGAFCPPGQGCKEGSAQHVYLKAGTYTARLVGNGEGKGRVLASTRVEVK